MRAWTTRCSGQSNMEWPVMAAAAHWQPTIHPTNKQEVGRRLSLWALAKTYGQPGLMYSGPSCRSMAKRDGAVVLRFDHADGLRTRDGEPPDWCGSTGGVALGLSYDENCTLARTPHIRQAVALIRRGLNKTSLTDRDTGGPAASDRRKPPLMSPRMSSHQNCPSANSQTGHPAPNAHGTSVATGQQESPALPSNEQPSSGDRIQAKPAKQGARFVDALRRCLERLADPCLLHGLTPVASLIT